MNLDDLQTGDIILVSNSDAGIFNYFIDMIKYSTHSNYVHIGMIVKNPEFTDKPLKGTYVWESSYEGTSDPQDGKIKFGVQLTDIEDMIDNYGDAKYFIRRLKDNTIFTNDKLKEIHNLVYDVPYDINVLDWIMAFFKKDITPQKISRLWCSALMGYIFTYLDVLNQKTDWSILYPCDFALDGENLNYSTENKLIEEEFLLLI